jgi:hypothetical protein
VSGVTPIKMTYTAAGRAHHLAFSGPSWSGTSTFAALSGNADTTVLCDTGVLGDASCPSLFFSGKDQVVVHAGPRGVEAARLTARGFRTQLVAPDAAVFAVAAGRHGSRIFTVDDRGVRAHTYDERGALGPSERWLDHVGKHPRIAAARAGTSELAFVAWEGERALWVIADEGDGKRRVVSHELPADCIGLSAAGAGNRAGLAVALAGLERIDVAQADARGALVERLNTCLEGRGATWRHPFVLWIEDGFHLVAVDQRSERTVVSHFDGTLRADVLGGTSPVSAEYREKRLVLARASMEDGSDRILVAGHRLALGADGTTLPFRLHIPPPRALFAHRGQLAAERLVRATALEFSEERDGYRDGRATGKARIDERDGSVVLVDPLHPALGSTSLAVRTCPEAHGGALGWDLTLVVLGKDAAAVPAPETSVERLASWVRTRLSQRAFARALAEQRWVEEAARSLDGEGFWDRDENGLRLVVHVAALPSAQELATWLRRLVDDVAGRVWERDPTPAQST